MKTYTIHIFEPHLDRAGVRELKEAVLQIRANTVDEARKQAKELLTGRGHKVRKLNFAPGDKILAYTRPGTPDEEAERMRGTAPPPEGWRYKKPPGKRKSRRQKRRS
jgi:hypothetical protein